MYHQIDNAIDAWVQRHGLPLYTALKGVAHIQIRCVYLTRHDESCRIWINAPLRDIVQVRLTAEESAADPHFRRTWIVLVPDLAAALDAAVHSGQAWLSRVRA